MRYRRDQGRLAQVCSPGTCYGPSVGNGLVCVTSD